MSAPGSKLTTLSWRALHSATRNQRASVPIARRWNSSFAPRVGKAVEPLSASDLPPEQTNIEPPEQKTDTSRSVVKTSDTGTFESSIVEDLKRQHAESIQSKSKAPGTTDGADAGSDGQKTGGKSPLDEVLGKEPPRKGHRTHPHMSPPPYIHNFDSYSMVKLLQEGGYTEDQAIEAMKGIRALLTQNLDVAQESLVSKSDVENVGFRLKEEYAQLIMGSGIVSLSCGMLGAEAGD